MLSDCLECRKSTKRKKPNIDKTNGRKMLSSNFAVYCSKKWRVLKEQKFSGFLSSFGIKKPLSQIASAGPILL